MTNRRIVQKMAEIDAMNVSEARRTEMRDAVLDGLTTSNLAEHYQAEGCPLCGSHRVVAHQDMVLCNGCERRVR